MRGRGQRPWSSDALCGRRESLNPPDAGKGSATLNYSRARDLDGRVSIPLMRGRGQRQQRGARDGGPPRLPSLNPPDAGKGSATKWTAHRTARRVVSIPLMRGRGQRRGTSAWCWMSATASLNPPDAGKGSATRRDQPGHDRGALVSIPLMRGRGQRQLADALDAPDKLTSQSP